MLLRWLFVMRIDHVVKLHINQLFIVSCSLFLAFIRFLAMLVEPRIPWSHFDSIE